MTFMLIYLIAVIFFIYETNHALPPKIFIHLRIYMYIIYGAVQQVCSSKGGMVVLQSVKWGGWGTGSKECLTLSGIE